MRTKKVRIFLVQILAAFLVDCLGLHCICAKARTVQISVRIAGAKVLPLVVFLVNFSEKIKLMYKKLCFRLHPFAKNKQHI